MHIVRPVAFGLLRRPWYATAIISVIAIASALLTTVFALVDGVLFKPLGYPGESRLVAIAVSSSHGPGSSVMPEDLAAWARALPGVALTGFRAQPVAASTAVGRAVVQANFFDVVGVEPALGGFAPADFEMSDSKLEPGIITDEILHSQFGGDASVIGRTVILDPSSGYGYRVVGVMPKGFTFPAYEFSVGYLTTYRRGSSVALRYIIARLPAEMSAAEVQQRLLAVTRMRHVVPSPRSGPGLELIDQVTVEPLSRALGAASRPLFTVLLVAAVVLMTMAVLNVSSLMAARCLDRDREFYIRGALGASWQRIGRLLLTEGTLLSAGGTATGVLVAVPMLRFTSTLLPKDLALFKVIGVDWRVVLFAGGVTLAAGMLVSLWPLRLAVRASCTAGVTSRSTVRVRQPGQKLVVLIQVAVAFLLTIGGTLLLASLLNVYWQEPTLESHNTLAIRVRFLGQEASAVNRFVPERVTRANAVIDRVRNLPGVEAAAVTAYELLDRAFVRSWFRVPDGALNPRRPVMTQAVTADFYRVIKPVLVEGRLPSAVELSTNEPVIVVSKSVARDYWPGTSAVGRVLTDQGPRPEPTRRFTVVGVVEDIRWYSWDEPALPMIYGPYALLARQAPAMVLVRRSSEGTNVQAEVLRAMAEADPWLQVGRVAPLDELFVDSVRQRRFLAWLFGSFSIAALCVVIIGVFGQLAMSTARRTREVGIRMSCGATPGSIMGMIIAEQFVPVLAGLGTGGVSAVWLTEFLRGHLYQVTTLDPSLWSGAAILILLAALAGVIAPALRASRIDPAEALRAE
jgi:putative ABC transport system permease protein